MEDIDLTMPIEHSKLVDARARHRAGIKTGAQTPKAETSETETTSEKKARRKLATRNMGRRAAAGFYPTATFSLGGGSYSNKSGNS